MPANFWSKGRGTPAKDRVYRRFAEYPRYVFDFWSTFPKRNKTDVIIHGQLKNKKSRKQSDATIPDDDKCRPGIATNQNFNPRKITNPKTAGMKYFSFYCAVYDVCGKCFVLCAVLMLLPTTWHTSVVLLIGYRYVSEVSLKCYRKLKKRIDMISIFDTYMHAFIPESARIKARVKTSGLFFPPFISNP